MWGIGTGLVGSDWRKGGWGEFRLAAVFVAWRSSLEAITHHVRLCWDQNRLVIRLIRFRWAETMSKSKKSAGPQAKPQKTSRSSRVLKNTWPICFNMGVVSFQRRTAWYLTIILCKEIRRLHLKPRSHVEIVVFHTTRGPNIWGKDVLKIVTGSML